jgi:hypothetical protein
MAMMAAQNLVDVLHGRPCDYVINPAALDVRKQQL